MQRYPLLPFTFVLFPVATLCAQYGTSSDSALFNRPLEEVVVTASRIQEKLLASPVGVSRMDSRQVRMSASPGFYDALGDLKGVQILTPSLGFRVINTRGFANTTNVRFVQLIDGVDNQAPHIGAPIANALAPSDLDILDMEIVQGIASALYGMNATNGLANIRTRNPFESEGISFRQQVAVNHVQDPHGVGAKKYTESAFRWANVLAKKWAGKVNVGFSQGYDWIAGNDDDLNPLANQTTNLTGADNPAYDAVNRYGNESSNRRTLSLNGKNYVVARTGYREQDVGDYSLRNLKADATLAYRPKEGTEISYTGRTAFLDNVYQRSNRFRLEDYQLQQHVLQFQSPLLQAKAYLNGENTGQSYNLRSVAENIERYSKSDERWFADYTKAFQEALKTDPDIAQAHRSARAAADAFRPQPGTTAFQRILDTLAQVNNWDIGAALRVRARLLHTEGVLDAGQLLKLPLGLHVGTDFRRYIIVPDGNYFINPVDSTRNLTYSRYGFFVHGTKQLLSGKLRLGAVLRADKNQYFNLQWNPRISAVYALSESGFLRVSYQNGARFPSIFEGFSNINSGGVKRVGGLRVMSDGIFEQSWLKSSIDAFQAAVNKDVNTLGISQASAIEKNKALLQRNPYTYLSPERMHTFEAGYRGFLFKKWYVDADLYLNRFSRFIAQVEASVPSTSDPAQIPASLFVRSRQARYRLWTNSRTIVFNYGAALELRYALHRNYELSLNASYAALKRTEQNDGLEDGFNTPALLLRTALNGHKFLGNWSGQIAARYQSSYYWQSFLVNGDVPAVFTLDAQLNYTFNRPLLNLKFGATNLLNRYYYSFLGGPQIGGFYYGTATYYF
ncbi:MAG: TonB-dependent receptor [Saprospiraceae bacterium]